MVFWSLVTSVVLVLALVKLLAEAAIIQTEAGARMIEQAENFSYLPTLVLVKT